MASTSGVDIPHDIEESRAELRILLRRTREQADLLGRLVTSHLTQEIRGHCPTATNVTFVPIKKGDSRFRVAKVADVEGTILCESPDCHQHQELLDEMLPLLGRTPKALCLVSQQWVFPMP